MTDGRDSYLRASFEVRDRSGFLVEPVTNVKCLLEQLLFASKVPQTKFPVCQMPRGVYCTLAEYAENPTTGGLSIFLSDFYRGL